MEKAEAESTPLEERLDQLGRKLVWVTLLVAAVVAVIGILRQRDLLLMVETSIALAVAAIPEGLPIVATIALARGMRRMARPSIPFLKEDPRMIESHSRSHRRVCPHL